MHLEVYCNLLFTLPGLDYVDYSHVVTEGSNSFVLPSCRLASFPGVLRFAFSISIHGGVRAARKSAFPFDPPKIFPV